MRMVWHHVMLNMIAYVAVDSPDTQRCWLLVIAEGSDLTDQDGVETVDSVESVGADTSEPDSDFPKAVSLLDRLKCPFLP